MVLKFKYHLRTLGPTKTRKVSSKYFGEIFELEKIFRWHFLGPSQAQDSLMVWCFKHHLRPLGYTRSGTYPKMPAQL